MYQRLIQQYLRYNGSREEGLLEHQVHKKIVTGYTQYNYILFLLVLYNFHSLILSVNLSFSIL